MQQADFTRLRPFGMSCQQYVRVVCCRRTKAAALEGHAAAKGFGCLCFDTRGHGRYGPWQGATSLHIQAAVPSPSRLLILVPGGLDSRYLLGNSRANAVGCMVFGQP
jgi:hypothetical protein